MQIALDRVLFKNTGPAKGNMSLGVTASCEVPTGDILVGSGDGTLQVGGGGTRAGGTAACNRGQRAGGGWDQTAAPMPGPPCRSVCRGAGNA